MRRPPTRQLEESDSRILASALLWREGALDRGRANGSARLKNPDFFKGGLKMVEKTARIRALRVAKIGKIDFVREGQTIGENTDGEENLFHMSELAMQVCQAEIR